MNVIKATVLGICISLIVIGMFIKLIPKCKNEKGMRYLLSLVVLLIIITPFNKSFALNFSLPEIEDESLYYNNSEFYNKSMVNALTQVLNNDVSEFLNNEGIEYYSINILTEETTNGEKICGIDLKIKSGYNPDEIEKIVNKRFDLPVNVEIGG